MDVCFEDILIFLIMLSSPLIRKATFIDQTLEESENIKDFLEILNPFFPLFFSKLYIDQNSLKSLDLLSLYEGHTCMLAKYYYIQQIKLLHIEKIRIMWIDVL